MDTTADACADAGGGRLAEAPAFLAGVRRIVFLGDSLTDGSYYPDYVVNTLNRLHPTVGFELLNAGVCGDTAVELLRRLEADVIKQGPDLVIVGIGTNDCSQRHPLDVFRSNMDEVVTRLREGGCRVMLLRPSMRTDPEHAARFPSYIDVIDAVAGDHGLPTADVYGAFERAAQAGLDVLGDDGVHHGRDGFAVMAQAVLDALGHPGVEMDQELRPDAYLLLEWETSDPVPWEPGEELPGLAAAGGWRACDREATMQALSWADIGFVQRGAWMPFAVEPPESSAMAFGRTTLDAAAEGPVELHLGGSHPLMVWLNGEEVWRSAGPHGYHACADRVPVTLQAGRNEVVVASHHMAFVGIAPADRLIRVDDCIIVRYPCPPVAEKRLAVDRRDRINAAALKGMDEPPAGGRLSGSFIYAHAANYRGRFTMDYGVAEWRALMRELKELGMDTVIFAGAARADCGECYYPSALFSGHRTWDILGPVLSAASDEGMTVYLGGAGIVFSEQELGAETGDTARAAACARQEVACYRELVERYGGAFQGYYMSSEMGVWAWGNRDYLERCYHEYFVRSTNGVKEVTPDIPVIGSPYTVATPGREDEAIDLLTRVHEGCPITALAPQDSIGTTMNTLDNIEAGLGIWKTVCRNIGARLWVNAESFSITDTGGPIMSIVPAEFKRFAVQLAAAHAAGAEKIVTWEAVHFMSPTGGEAARRLRRDYLASGRVRDL